MLPELHEGYNIAFLLICNASQLHLQNLVILLTVVIVMPHNTHAYHHLLSGGANPAS
jgi:hypothetical protein